MSKKRVLIFQQFLAPYRIDLLNDLCATFDARVLIMFTGRAGQAFDQKQLASDVMFIPCSLSHGGLLGQMKDVLEEIATFDPDLVIVPEFNHLAVAAVLRRSFSKKKYRVISICDDSFDMVSGNEFTLRHRIARRIVAPHLDEIVSVEPRVAKWYEREYGHGYFFPIIKDEFRARLAYKDSLSLKQGLVDTYGLAGKRVFLFVGRLVKLKNVDTLIRAFSRYENKDSLLVIVGDGPEHQYLMDLSSGLDCNIVFTGFLEGPELNVWYNIAQVFVLPSYQEAFGAVTNEALIAGCSCLVSDKAGSQCLIKDGVNGYVFDSRDEDDLGRKLSLAGSLACDVVPDGELRKSKMLVDYRTSVNALINHLNSL